MAGADARGRHDGRRAPAGRHAPGERAAAGIAAEELAARLPPSLLTVDDLHDWLLAGGLAVEHAGLLSPTETAKAIVHGIAP